MFSIYYRNVQLLILTIVLIVVWGLSAFLSLPRMEDPELIPRAGVIRTVFPGASAERVESLITDKLESELADIEEIDLLESTSRANVSVITVHLKETFSQVDEVWSRVRDQMADAETQLPLGIRAPELDIIKVKANALIVGLMWTLDMDPSPAILRRQAEALEDQIRQIPGTEDVELFGDPDEEILIAIDSAALARLQLTPQQLAAQVQASDAKVTAGQLQSEQSNLLLEVSDELASLERIRTIPIQQGDGSFTMLGDIATVERGIRTPPDEVALTEGHPAIVVAATTDSGTRVDLWAERARQRLTEFEGSLPEGLGIRVILDQSQYVEARLDTVIGNLMVGATLVLCVTFVVMGWRSAVIVGSALPLASLMVLGGMTLLEVPLHQMSITGLIIALGLLIDNAIITVDEVQIRIQEGMDPGPAVADSTRHLAIPLLCSTLTTVLAFFPIALAPGGVGEFTGAIGLTVILALTSSLVLSLTVLPALVGRLRQQAPVAPSSGWWQVGVSNPGLTRVYRWTLQRILSKPLIGIGLSLVLPIAGFTVAPQLPQQFFPPAGRDQFFIEMQFPIQTAIAETQRQVQQASEIIQGHHLVESVDWFMGNRPPQFYYNVFAGTANSPHYGQALVKLQTAAGYRPLIQTLQQELDLAFPEAQVLVRQLEQGPPFDAPVEIFLSGPDLSVLREQGNDLRRILMDIPDVIHTRATLTEALPKLGLALNEEDIRFAGLDKTQIARQLDTALQGVVGGSILEDTEEIPVRVRVGPRDRQTLNQIESLDLVGSLGQTLPLSAVGSVDLVPDLARIERREGQRTNTIQAFITAGVLPSVILAEFKDRLEAANFTLPPGYTFTFGGESDARSEALVNLLSTAGVLGILMTATLVLSFNSFALAGLIGFIALCSAGLGQLALYLTGYPFGFTAILGTLGLIGLAINDSIVILAALREDPRSREGNPQAILAVIMRGTRHIIATTLTTLIGFVPLMFDATGFWPPLAICIAGGLGGTTLMALYCVPAVYVLITRRQWSRQQSAALQLAH